MDCVLVDSARAGDDLVTPRRPASGTGESGMIAAVTFAGILATGGLGAAAVRRRFHASDLAEWAVGGGRLGAMTLWFLQAGEAFTTFTFFGLSGRAYSGGAAALHAPVYGASGYVILRFLCGRVWTIGHQRGYLTHGDFLEDRFASRVLGTTSAVSGVAFVLPYLQLQITGLGLIVSLVTGGSGSGTVSMVIGTVVVATFVLWSGLRGVAATSYFKDVVMVLALVVLAVAVPAHVAGGPRVYSADLIR